MSDLDLTVRDTLVSYDAVRTYLAAVDSMTRSLGSEEWQDTMTNGELWQHIWSRNPIGEFLRMDGMASTLRQIEALPETT